MKKLKKILIVLVGIIILIIAGLYVYLRITLPKTEGILDVKNITKDIQVKRNEWGVPFIEATNMDDLFFAVGFCHASDRLFQMDLSRRMAEGKLAEVFGEMALDSDKYHKELLIEESIERSMKALRPEVETALQHYCDGVNSFIETRTLPPEFTLLRYTPEPWTIKDIYAIFKNMEMILADSGSELYNAKILRILGEEHAENFIYGTYGSTIINRDEYETISQNRSLAMALLNEIELKENSVGSNNWVISGKKTVTGAPILANDPHLSNVFPSYFYQIFATNGDLELSGNTLPGVPFIIIGRNNHVGWGFTNVGTDVIDYFILEQDPQNKNRYKWDGDWVDFDLIEKRIKVKGKEDVLHVVKLSRLGPVFEENGICFARHSVDEYPSTTVDAFFQMQSAKNLEDFIKGLKHFTSPAQNVVFADKEGNIGYFPTGLVPKRKKGNGELPLPASGSSDGWDGFYSEDEKPLLLNPEKGYIATANNPVLPETGLPIFAKTWFPSFRADRINEMIEAKEKLSVEDNALIQTDRYLKSAEFLMQKIKDFNFTPGDSEGAAFVLSHLSEWNFKVGNGIAPFLFYRFRYYLARNIFADNMGKEEENKSLISSDWLYRIMNYPGNDTNPEILSYWSDDIDTPEKEDFNLMVRKSMEETYKDYLEKSKSQDMGWLKIHTLKYSHPLGRVAVVGWLLNKGPFPMEGGRDCILTASFRRNSGFKIVHLSTFRMVMDFSNFSNSMLIYSSGQSGHFMSKNYDDQIGLYVSLKYRKMEDASSKPQVLKLKKAP